MKPDKPAETVLIVSSPGKGRDFLSNALTENGYRVNLASDSGDALRRTAEFDFDAVVINAPVAGVELTELAASLCEKTCSGIVVLLPSDRYEETAYSLEAEGCATLPKPLPKLRLMQAIHLVCVTRARLVDKQREKQSIFEKMEEINLVGRAKLLLMQNLGMTESAAHRYIEKRAMDECVKRIVIAREIIATY